MKIKIYADGANLEDMLTTYRQKDISGFTTNPTLMKKAGITNYEHFAREALSVIRDLPISFEVFSDNLEEMKKQAHKIASWGDNVYVKIPITNTQGEFTGPVIKELSHNKIKLNVTAIFTIDQVRGVLDVADSSTPIIVSIFGGRIANAGIDPVPIMSEAVKIARHYPKCEILWASPREAFNIIQAEQCGCHIITVTPEILRAASDFGKDLNQFSLETVQMFYSDAQNAGYVL